MVTSTDLGNIGVRRGVATPEHIGGIREVVHSNPKQNLIGAVNGQLVRVAPSTKLTGLSLEVRELVGGIDIDWVLQPPTPKSLRLLKIDKAKPNKLVVAPTGRTSQIITGLVTTEGNLFPTTHYLIPPGGLDVPTATPIPVPQRLGGAIWLEGYTVAQLLQYYFLATDGTIRPGSIALQPGLNLMDTTKLYEL